MSDRDNDSDADAAITSTNADDVIVSTNADTTVTSASKDSAEADELLQTLLAEHVSSPRQIKFPVYDRDAKIRPTAGDLFDGENSEIQQQINIWLPRVRTEEARRKQFITKLMMTTANLRKDIAASRPRSTFTFVSVVFAFVYASMYGLMATVGIFFIQTYLRAGSLALQLSGLGPIERVTSYSLVPLSFIAAALLFHRAPARLHSTVLFGLAAFGFPAFLSGFIALLGHGPGERLNIAATLLSDSSSNQAMLDIMWLSSRLCGETALLTILGFLIYSMFYKDSERTPSDAEKRLKSLDAEVKQNERDYSKLVKKLQQLGALKTSYETNRKAFIAAYAR